MWVNIIGWLKPLPHKPPFSGPTEVYDLHVSNNLYLQTPRLLFVLLLPKIETLRLSREEDGIWREDDFGICWYAEVDWPGSFVQVFLQVSPVSSNIFILHCPSPVWVNLICFIKIV